MSFITGLENCTEGQILYDGKELKKMNLDTYRNTDIGIVFQSYNLLPRLTALENIILSMDISKVKVEDKKQKALENGLDYLEISYTDFDILENILAQRLSRKESREAIPETKGILNTKDEDIV